MCIQTVLYMSHTFYRRSISDVCCLLKYYNGCICRLVLGKVSVGESKVLGGNFVCVYVCALHECEGRSWHCSVWYGFLFVLDVYV